MRDEGVTEPALDEDASEPALDEDVDGQLARLAPGSSGRLAGRVALVSGAGAVPSGPIGTGAATAVLLAANGARLLILDADSERAELTCELIRARRGEAQPFVADATDLEACERSVAAARETWGGLDVLVNNVGVSPAGSVLDVGLATWEAAYRTNVTSALLLTRAAAEDLAVGHGAVVNISSTAATRPNGRAAYATSKSALIALTHETAYTLGPRGVRANCVLPGQIHAPMSAAVGSELRRRRRLTTMLGTEGTAWDVAATANFLASDEARWITGAVIPVDAGGSQLLPLTADGLHD